MKTRAYLPAIIIGSAVLFILWKLAFTNLILARGDTLLYIYPYWEHRARTLLAEQLPLWNTYLFMGAPFLANPQAGVLYPLNWPLVVFEIPTAVKLAVIAHLLIAAVGAFKLARRVLHVSATAATVTSILFALGGHLTGKIEQVNQLQALAWMPWVLLSTHLQITASSARERTRAGLTFAAVLALQLLAGHTQTTFITLASAMLWWLTSMLANSRRTNRVSAIRSSMTLLTFTILGASIAGAQLIPALELARYSLRSSGLSLTEALSFSLNPVLLGRALLPSFSRPLFTEFLGYIGITGLLLAITGILSNKPSRTFALPAIALSCCGIFLALGAYNPIYWALAKFAPGFDLFRAPARWLALWAIGTSLLAGLGFDRMVTVETAQRRRLILIFVSCTLILVTLAFVSTGVMSPGETGPLPIPAPLDIGAWTFVLIGALAALLFPSKARDYLTVLIALELGLASLQLPVRNLTAAEAYSSVRAPMTQLLIHRDDMPVPDRIFSMARLQFDPGDLEEMRARLNMILSENSVTLAVNATKSKEVLAPNLPLSWRIPTIDGYDGGVLPLRTYANFVRQFTPENKLTEDGRLREKVTTTPDNWLLNITNTRWLVADKLEDIWRNDVFYDLQFQVTLPPGASTNMKVVPTFLATDIGLVLSATNKQNLPLLGQLQLRLTDGTSHTVNIPPSLATGGGRIPLKEPMNLTDVTVYSEVDELQLHGVTVIDSRTGAFTTLTLAPYRIVHSGDVKIYENLNVFPRAYLVQHLPVTPKTNPIGKVTIHTYTSNHIVISSESAIPATLVLADANYPGWVATVGGQATTIETTNGFFRAVQVPSGVHEIIFDYQPLSWRWGLSISALAMISCLVGLLRLRHLRP